MLLLFILILDNGDVPLDLKSVPVFATVRHKGELHKVVEIGRPHTLPLTPLGENLFAVTPEGGV